VDRWSSGLSRPVASMALVVLALSCIGCSVDAKPNADAAVSGAGTGVSTAGVGTVAGTSAVLAGVGGSSGDGAGGVAAGSGGQAGSAPLVCTVPDDLALTSDDADGGVASDCQNIPRTIIANNCIGGICHHSPNKFQAPAGKLDLMTPCVADRLINTPSTCQGIVFIDVAKPEQSFLLNKLEAEKPICGEPMPFTGHLPLDQQRCMHAWVNAVVRAAKP
jgi:hypothetical protein